MFNYLRRTAGKALRIGRHSSRNPLLAGVAIMLATAVGPTAAHATVFAGSATFTDTTTGNPLNVQAFPNPKNFATVSLVAGHSDYLTGFMTLTTTDTQTGNGVCLWFLCSGVTNTDTIGLTFVWTQPGTATSNTNFPGDVAETTFSLTPSWTTANWIGRTTPTSTATAGMPSKS